MNKSDYIDRLRQSRRPLQQVLAEMSEDELVRPNTINKLSVKDLLGHLAAWDEEVIRVIQAYAMQPEPKFSYTISSHNDYAVWNLQQIQQRESQTLAETIREMDMARRDLIQVVDGLTDPVLRREKTTPWSDSQSAYKLLDTQIEHDEEHTQQILAWRKKIARWKRARAKLTAKRKGPDQEPM